MSRHRLFISQPISEGETLCLDGEQGHYLSRVLRLKRGSEVLLFDGRNYEYPALVTEVHRKRVCLRPGAPLLQSLESPLKIRLVQGIARGERMDFVIQKATELGVHRISPVLTEFSVVKLQADRAARRLAHWNKIAHSACEQCGRNRIPVIDEPSALHDFLRGNTPAEGRLLLQPSATVSLQQVDAAASSLDLLIGPEGGMSDTETEMLLDAGFKAVSLGPRVLRTETAALAAIAILQAKWGDL
ncbi:MAG: 16S rRNA (uracil(1498)-N(3))-methyltransferase [Gammaproteobacteria bacterium]|nr:16S rRNA (uracil(1498)-N(3))-methyltransferase [Gammaproteobacteria bacterium]